MSSKFWSLLRSTGGEKETGNANAKRMLVRRGKQEVDGKSCTVISVVL